MKIAIATNKSWNIYNFRKGLVQSFLEAGHEVVAIAPRDAYTPFLEEWGCSYQEIQLTGTGTHPWEELQVVRRFRKIVTECGADILLTYTIKINIYGILAARNAGIPIICNVSGLGTVFLWKGLVSYVARILYRLTFSRASFVFFQNEEDKDLFLKTIALPETKVGLLPGSGINLMEYSVQPYQPGPNPVFLMIARVLEDKGVREFVGAARQVHQLFPNCVFRLVGGMDEPHPRGIKQREVDEWVQQGWIQYGGHTDEVAGEIGRADVIVLPSYREGTPRSLLEGAAMGRALIATDVPGCHQVVKNNYNGLLCAPYSAESLAGAILQYCGMNDQEKIEMARNSRTFVEQFFDEKLVIGLYQQKIRELTFIEQ